MLAIVVVWSCLVTLGSAEPFRLGIVGTDTSHVPAYVNLFNDPAAEGAYQNFEITAAFPGGMPDNPKSWDRKDKYAAEIAQKGVKIYDSLEEMIASVDGVLIESVDGRPHLEFARPVIQAKKPLFIDKPMAGDLVDVVEIFRLAKEKGVPVFSASSLRYSAAMQEIRNASPFGKTHGVDAWSPCSLEEHHPDLYWYGIHGVETLFTMMGPGCESVSRTTSEQYDLVVGLWKDGRIGTFRGIRSGAAPYGGCVFGDKGVQIAGKYDGYKPLCDQICVFFETKKSPVAEQETLEIMAFMTAADESKKREGAHVSLDSVIEKAKTANVVYFHVTLAEDGGTLLDGENVSEEQLLQKLTLPEGSENTYYRVILKKEKNVPLEKAVERCGKLGNATLVRFAY